LLERVYQVKIGTDKRKSCCITITQTNIHFLDSSSRVEDLILTKHCYLNHSLQDKNLKIHAVPKINNRRRSLEICVESDSRHDLIHLNSLLDSLQLKCAARKKLLVFVNPFSGTLKAVDRWDQVSSLLDRAGVEAHIVVTNQRNHALNAVKEAELEQYSGIVTVSGDGLIHEVMNGLSQRKDWNEIRKRLPLGIVPGGSGNAIHCSILYQQREHFKDELLAAGLNLARGRSVPADYLQCQTEKEHLSSMLGVAWGLIPDVDIGSEVIRWAGFVRAYLWLLFRILKPRLYCGKVHYLPSQPSCHTTITDWNEPLPQIDEPVPPNWTTVEGEFLTVYACKQSWLDYTTRFIPGATLDDGNIYLVIVFANVVRLDLVRFLLDPCNFPVLQGIHVIPIKAFRFEMESADDPLTVDAETLSCSVVQGRVVAKGWRILLKEDENAPDQSEISE